MAAQVQRKGELCQSDRAGELLSERQSAATINRISALLCEWPGSRG
jgi:hypothetical protein